MYDKKFNCREEAEKDEIFAEFYIIYAAYSANIYIFFYAYWDECISHIANFRSVVSSVCLEYFNLLVYQQNQIGNLVLFYS